MSTLPKPFRDTWKRSTEYRVRPTLAGAGSQPQAPSPSARYPPRLIACWFIDTDYNSESFFVRHAYFTGADEPYEKLNRALRADIDEAAWNSLYVEKEKPRPVAMGD